MKSSRFVPANPVSEEVQQMSNFNRLRSLAAKVAWLDPHDLAEAQTIFTVTEMRYVARPNNPYGDQWHLTIQIRPDSIPTDVQTNIPDNVKTKVSLPTGDTRDTHFQSVVDAGELPAYNCMFFIQPLTAKTEFIDLVMLEPGDEGYQAPPAKPVAAATRPQASSTIRFSRKSTGQALTSTAKNEDPFLSPTNDLP